MLTQDNVFLLLTALIGLVILKLAVSWSKRPKYLPGPPRLPLIGNLLQMPESEAWVTYKKWGEKYGDAMYLEIMGSPLVILNSYNSIVDILEKRSDIYSDRPVGVMANILMGWSQAVVMAPYNDRWRRFRRLTTAAMRKDAAKQFHPVQEKEVARYLGSLVKDPEHFMENFRLAAGRSLLYNFYGIDVKGADDPIITTAEKAMSMATFAAQPGNFLVDFFPALVHVPKWFPGAGWKKFAEEGKGLAVEMVNIPFNITKKAMEAGTNETSFTSINLDKKEDEDIVKWCAGTMLSGTKITSVASVHAFFLAMVLHPDIQKRCQEELDSVIGPDRLPVVADRDNLPYLSATMKELMRWQPVSPLALPHRLIKDDVYKGAVIPAGTVVMANTWAVTRDPSLFPNPEKFDPNRYLPMFDKSIPHDPKDLPLDTESFAFGFGRRICAGMHYADSMLLISMARILSTFDIRPAKDANGKEIIPDIKFNSDIVRESLDFKCSITPRSDAAKALISEYTS
ncbi:cytochrome P450 [Pholiota conissans]|uniref:Cytochrome P450 n=1 Tax=Pholiota conissans TaxID=109636 RepID=A0A9P5ZAY3_9AGAR|nr:cytochrome P450 [Pholiota conissans]